MMKKEFSRCRLKTTGLITPSISLLIGFMVLALLGSCMPSLSAPALVSEPGPVFIYYVSTNGNDGNPGTEALPWRTIQKAADTAAVGGVVEVLAGSYAERVKIMRPGIIFEGNGAEMHGFVVMADNTTIRNFHISKADGNGIEVLNANCTLEDNYIYFPKGWGILTYRETSACVIRNNKIERSTGSGMEVLGTNHIVEGNEIWGVLQAYPGEPLTPFADADGIKFFGSGHIFRNNYIHDIHYGIPENINPHIDCFQTWTDEWHPLARNVLFEGNVCINFEAVTENERGQGFMIGTGNGHGGGQNNITIRNNLFVTTRAINVVNARSLTIENNTFISKVVNPASGPLALTYGILLTDSKDNTIKGNIFDVTGAGSTCHISGGISDGNLFFRSDGLELNCSPAPGDLWGVDPLFVNPGGGDYRLQPGSPAIGAGVDGTTFGAFEALAR